MKRLLNLAVGVAAVCGLSSAASAQDWYTNTQREQIHQQFLTPAEHNALHSGMNAGYGTGLSTYPYGTTYGSTYGSYGVGTGMYPSSSLYSPYNYNRTRVNCSNTMQYQTPLSNSWRRW
jgi:hypothetical protein